MTRNPKVIRRVAKPGDSLKELLTKVSGIIVFGNGKNGKFWIKPQLHSYSRTWSVRLIILKWHKPTLYCFDDFVTLIIFQYYYTSNLQDTYVANTWIFNSRWYYMFIIISFVMNVNSRSKLECAHIIYDLDISGIQLLHRIGKLFGCNE